MLVKVLSFGSNWWRRSLQTAAPARHAGYNSTGLRCGRKMRRHWIVPGVLRFNAAANYAWQPPTAAIGHTFICSDLTYAFGGNRLLFRKPAEDSASPDYYLVAISSGLYGNINFRSAAWKSVFSRVVAVSQLRDQQETMLLMHACDWVQTSRGFWQLHVPHNRQQAPDLVLISRAATDEEDS
jgi:hypothetical protein